jgi:hypothetical protein
MADLAWNATPNYPVVTVWNDSGVGFKTHVEIDGVDVSACFDRVEIVSAVKGAVTAKLSVCLPALRYSVPGPLVELDEDTQYALKALGWRPPAQPGDDDAGA